MEKKNRVILPVTTGNKSDDRNISSDVEDNTFPALSLTNGSSSESESSYEEKCEDFSGKVNSVSSDEAVEEDESKKKTTTKHQKQRIKREECQPPDVLNITFTETPVDVNLDECSDPIAFFRYFFTDEILQYICDESNKYAIQPNPNKPLLLTKDKLEQFIGILFMMFIIKIPSAKSYWELETRYDNCIALKVAGGLSRNKFLEIKQFIHCNDNMTAPQPLNDLLQWRNWVRTWASAFLAGARFLETFIDVNGDSPVRCGVIFVFFPRLPIRVYNLLVFEKFSDVPLQNFLVKIF